MKRALLFAFLPVLFLFGCTAFVTFVESPGEYEEIPINSGRIFSKKKLIAGEYHLLKLKESSSSFRSTGGPGPGIMPPVGPATSKANLLYETYRGNTRIDLFAIHKLEEGAAIGSGTTLMLHSETYLYIWSSGKNYIKVTINPQDQTMPSVLFTLSGDNMSHLWSAGENSLTVTRYYKNTVNTDSTGSKGLFGIPVISGLRMEVNGEEYGILALHPKPVFHKKRSFNKEIDAAYGDKLISYMLMAHEALYALNL